MQRLTPVQLQLDGEPGGSDLEKRLAAAYVQLCLMYTCDRAARGRRTTDGLEVRAIYQGGGLAVQVPLYEAKPISMPLKATEEFARLIDWCYQLGGEATTRDWATDRLQFARVRIARLLEPAQETDRLASLVARIRTVMAELDSQWRAFIEDRLGQYLEKERDLERVVNEAVRSFGEKATALTKSLTDAMLAAVAALIGSAIAAAFKTPFNSALFRVGVFAYAGYVLVYPGLYGLGSRLGEYRDASRTFEQDKNSFEALLPMNRTEQIVGARVTEAKRRYRWWFALTLLGYAIAVAGAVVAAILVPPIVA